MIEKMIEDAFDKMYLKYYQLLKSFYPAQGSTGFTERNQTHNFVNSLISTLNDKDTINWFELPWKEKEQHIDAMVYSPEYKSIFYIEAKRLSITRKKESIVEDIKRVVDTKDRESLLSKYKLPNVTNEYMIALCDVWLENKWKRNVPFWWTGKKSIKGFEDLTFETKASEKTFAERLKKCDPAINWENGTQLIKRFTEDLSSECLKNYCLLMSYNKL